MKPDNRRINLESIELHLDKYIEYHAEILKINYVKFNELHATYKIHCKKDAEYFLNKLDIKIGIDHILAYILDHLNKKRKDRRRCIQCKENNCSGSICDEWTNDKCCKKLTELALYRLLLPFYCWKWFPDEYKKEKKILEEACEYLWYDDYFLSYTGKKARFTNLKYFNDDNAEAHKASEVLNKLLQSRNRGFYDGDVPNMSATEKKKLLKEHLGKSYLFIQLLEPASFVEYSDNNENWCYWEFKKFNSICSKLCDQRIVFAFLNEIKTIKALNLSSYEDWKKAIYNEKKMRSTTEIKEPTNMAHAEVSTEDQLEDFAFKMAERIERIKDNLLNPLRNKVLYYTG